MYVRKYIRGGSCLCWCGNPRRPGQRLCLDCHARAERTRRKRRPRSENYSWAAKKPGRPAQRRIRRVQPKPRLNIRTTLAPVMQQLEHIMTYSEAHKVDWDLACLLDRQILPLTQPLGIGYKYIWNTDVPQHLFYNLMNPTNHIKIT